MAARTSCVFFAQMESVRARERGPVAVGRHGADLEAARGERADQVRNGRAREPPVVPVQQPVPQLDDVLDRAGRQPGKADRLARPVHGDRDIALGPGQEVHQAAPAAVVVATRAS